MVRQTNRPEPVDARLPAALRDVRGHSIKNRGARRCENRRRVGGDYASSTCVRFQRPQCIITELASLGTADGPRRRATRKGVGLAGSGALLLVDHVHFQYNGLLLGLLVYTLFMLRRGDHVKAGALFALLCCAKHLF